MRVGVVSDSHGDILSLKKAVQQAGDISLWVHAGDHFRDAQVLANLTGMPVKAVPGNCDPGETAPPELFWELAGRKIMLTHGHRYKVKHSYDELAWWGRHYGVDVLIFGHTHIPFAEWRQGVLLFNPGSVACPRGGTQAGFGILEFIDTTVLPRSLTIGS